MRLAKVLLTVLVVAVLVVTFFVYQRCDHLTGNAADTCRTEALR